MMDGSRSRELSQSSLFGSRSTSRRNRRRSCRRRRLGAAIESLEQRQLLTFAIDLFADINQLGVSSNVEELVTVGNDYFFVADDGLTGSELWKTDGTTGGTVLVRDVLPGPDTSAPEDLTNVNGVLYFTALDENGETDLWSSDGTEAGTVQVFDADTSGVYYLNDLTASGGKLFFTAYEPATGYELWVHDPGTNATTLVLDINPDQLIIDRPQELTDVNGTLFFTSYDDGYYNRELWMSDGTAAGTMMVRDLGIDPGPDGILGNGDDDETVSSNPSYLTEVNGELFFVAEDYEYGIELFKSDGTLAGTMMVADLNPSGSSYPLDLTSFDNQVFFSAVAAGNDRHVYRSDGNTVTLVADTTQGLGSSSPSDFEVVGNELFFAANGAIPATRVEADLPGITANNSTNFFAGLVAETTSTSNGTLSFFNGTQTFNAINQGGSDDGPGWVSSGSRPGAAGVGLSNIAIGDLYIQTIGASELTDFFWEWTISDPGGLTNISFDGFASGNQMNNETNEGLVFELFLNGS
ncbi:MAG: ELWxxDGT repeat protein, partial [Planctomycetota bacterium]